MSDKAGHSVEVLLGLILVSLVLGASSIQASQQSSGKVFIRDVGGRLIHTSRYIWLAPDRAGVHASTFRQLGLHVGYARNEGRVYIAIPETDIMMGFRPKAHRLYHPETGELPHTYSYPVAKRRSGRIYVAAGLAQEGFPDWFTVKWDAGTRTLTLQRRPRKSTTTH